MEGENKPQERKQKEHRRPPGQGTNRNESEGGHKDRNRNRRTGGGGGGRKGVYTYEDKLEHVMCQMVTHELPPAFPVIARNDLATSPAVEVARRDSMILLCDRLHDGPHLWPNGDEVL